LRFKHDGFRFIARRGTAIGCASSRATPRDWTDKVPTIAEALLALPVSSATVDGEGVVVDDRGVTDFERLRTALAGRGGSRAAFLYAFDLLAVDGSRSTARALGNPPRTLTGLLRKAGLGVRLSEHLNGDGETIFRHACAPSMPILAP
jgi:bifunctional non-homologous end joining protein LigD